MKVLVAMSGGVDSSVAAAILLAEGHRVTGVTMKLWGGESDSGCCSVSDVDDARRVAHQLGIDHHVFDFSAEFERDVVDPYVDAHRSAATPNPCIECNRHLKFDRLLRRAHGLGFDTVATGHHARIVAAPGGELRVARGADERKDQSYVLHMLAPEALARVRFPVGDLTKDEVRARAAGLGLRTASKPDSQDVCFITAAEGRAAFLGARIGSRPARVVDPSGRELATVASMELVTVGQRKGLALAGAPARRYVTDVDATTATITVGAEADLRRTRQEVRDLRWAGDAQGGPLLGQCSAHGPARRCRVERGAVVWDEPQRRVAPGQAVVLYDSDVVVGSAVAA